MHFHYIHNFALFIPFFLLILIILWAKWRRRRDIEKLGDWNLIKELIPLEALIRRRKKDLLALIGLLFVIFAATGPQFGSKLKEVKARGVDVFIAMDTSRSMLAEDVPPSRLSRAKRALSLLIQKLEGNRVGIIAYAQFAAIQCPLTVDTEAARMFLDILDVNTIPVQGTSIGDAIRLGLKSFPKESKGGKAIVLLTDGEDHESDPIAAAKESKEEGVVVFTIGIGTTKGEVIKKRDDRGKVTEFHKFKGEMVLSRLDDALLTKIATITGGKYFRASSTDKEIDEIADVLNGFDKREFSSKIYQRLKERYQIFLFLGFLLLFIEFLTSERKGQWVRVRESFQEFLKRKGLIGKAALFLILFPFLTHSLQADLKSHVLKGNRFAKKGDMAGARGEFESAQIDAPESPEIKFNIATTYHLEGNFEEAKVHYEQAFGLSKTPEMKSRIAYNLGHLLFFMQDKSGAIEKFKESLKYNPKDIDAKYNIEYIKAGKQPKNPPPSQKKDKGGGEQKKQEEPQQGQQDGQSGEREKKNGELSKEDAERVLQLIQGHEEENMRDQQPRHQISKGQKDKKKEKNAEDW